MRRTAAASAVFGLALLAVTAVGQPPAGGDKKPAEKPKVDTVEAQIAAALANDPDVRMARAKIQLAEAELAKARQQVTMKVVTLQSAIQEQKAAVATAEQGYALINEMHKLGQGAQQELLAAREKLETAQAALAKLETELRLMTGGGQGGAGAARAPDDAVHRDAAARGLTCAVCHADGFGAAGPGGVDPTVTRGLAWLAAQQLRDKPAAGTGDATQFWQDLLRQAGAAEKAALGGPIPDRIRAALDKRVTLAPKGEKVPLDKALEVFKREAGLDVPVRGVGTLVQAPSIHSEGEELPVGAWLQLYQDWSGRSQFFVREYGLLFTAKEAAPPDALTLTQFWKLNPAAKGEMPKGGLEKK